MLEADAAKITGAEESLLVEWRTMLDWVVARFRSTKVARYAVSIVTPIVAAALTALIIHFKLPRQLTGYGFLLVIIASAWCGGYGPGLLTAAATLLLGPYLTQPTYSIHHPNLNSGPMVILISVLISRMAGSRQKLREANEKLDMRVRERTAELETVNGFLRVGQAEVSEVDPNEAVLIATTNLRSQIEKEGATVTSIELPKLVANSGHLIQIFQNLIGNGLKYRGEDAPRIVVSATNSQEEWICSVKDNGIGIAPDYHEKIFIPFKRLHGSSTPAAVWD